MSKLARRNGSTSVILRVKILDATSTVGAGLTGLTSASSGLRISTIASNEATATVYTVAGSTIETITTLGTYAAPTATKCRFKEVDATNHKGVYEIQLADARFAVAGAKSLIVSVLGATNAAEVDLEIDLQAEVDLEYVAGTSVAPGSVGPVPLFALIDRGTAQSATASTLQLRAAAAFGDDQILGATVVITGGSAGVGQSRTIIDYVSSTDTVTVSSVWQTTPTGTITYEIYGSPLADSVAQTGDAFAQIGIAGAGLTAVPWNAAWDVEVESEVLDAQNTILADSVPADGTIPTLRQAIYMVTQFLLERAVSGTTVTVKKANGSTTLMTLTLDSASTPTSITRAT